MSRMPKKSQYRYGRRKEQLVARSLRSRGYKCQISPGSKGSSDIHCVKGRRKWKVQVKATRGSRPPRINPEGRRRLKIQATKTKSIPVIAEVIRKKITFRSLRSGRKLKP